MCDLHERVRTKGESVVYSMWTRLPFQLHPQLVQEEEYLPDLQVQNRERECGVEAGDEEQPEKSSLIGFL